MNPPKKGGGIFVIAFDFSVVVAALEAVALVDLVVLGPTSPDFAEQLVALAVVFAVLAARAVGLVAVPVAPAAILLPLVEPADQLVVAYFVP